MADADFNGNLPVRSWAERNFIGRIENQGVGGFAQFRVAKCVPKQRVRVGKEPHGIYSAKSVASIWSATAPLPSSKQRSTCQRPKATRNSFLTGVFGGALLRKYLISPVKG